MADIEIPTGEGKKDEKQVGIIIAIIAVLMAIVGSLADNAADDMIVGEVKSSNGFAWYQAKRQREYLNDLELHRIAIELAGNPGPEKKAALNTYAAELRGKNLEYRTENDQIRKKAEQDGVAAKVAGDRNDAFGHAEILLQVAVVLCSLKLLTNSRGFLVLGVIVALGGVLLGGRAYFQKPPAATQPGVGVVGEEAFPVSSFENGSFKWPSAPPSDSVAIVRPATT
jgi:hypothetical protein